MLGHHLLRASIVIRLFIVSFVSGVETDLAYYKWDPQKFSLDSHSMTKELEGALALKPGFFTFEVDVRKALDITNKSFSQVGQDLLVVDILGGNNVKGGFFVDLAANDWRYISNTLLLELDHQLNGICIEPNPQYLVGLLSNRRCKVVTNPVSGLTNQNVTFRFDDVFGGIVDQTLDNKPNKVQRFSGYGSKAQEVQLPTVSLALILTKLNAPNVIDYLSLDVEGAEFMVLQHHDFGMYRFKCMSIERPSIHLHKLLSAHGYRWLGMLGDFGDMMYIHKSLPNYKNLMPKYADLRNTTEYGNGQPNSVEGHSYMQKLFHFSNAGELHEHEHDVDLMYHY